jgi:hypothetical protein
LLLLLLLGGKLVLVVALKILVRLVVEKIGTTI